MLYCIVSLKRDTIQYNTTTNAGCIVSCITTTAREAASFFNFRLRVICHVVLIVFCFEKEHFGYVCCINCASF